ncbi:ankyrin repeat domain-containing protein [Candidatus Midichloria mitochondrii]|uniref:ankyrin repeat domain-containing protein n=1 Tax=Candidatus Midichloria mitochondrii TaxID=234827 RepID=UPI000A01CADB
MPNNEGLYPIHLAAENNRYLSVKYLLENGAMEAINADGNTLPLVAARSGSYDVFNLLLKNNATLTFKNPPPQQE